jgi:hypothetical protein
MAARQAHVAVSVLPQCYLGKSASSPGRCVGIWSEYLAGAEPGRAKQGSVPLFIPRDGPAASRYARLGVKAGAPLLMFASTLAERPGVDRFEADPVDQLRRSLTFLVVGRDRNTKPLGVSQWDSRRVVRPPDLAPLSGRGFFVDGRRRQGLHPVEEELEEL